jgi:hypothetical protein
VSHPPFAKGPRATDPNGAPLGATAVEHALANLAPDERQRLSAETADYFNKMVATYKHLRVTWADDVRGEVEEPIALLYAQIDAWHAAPGEDGPGLPAWLGLTDEEYALAVTDPVALVARLQAGAP